MALTSFSDQERAFGEGRFLRVVNFHNTPASEAEKLRRELGWYAAQYDCVTLEDLDGFFTTGQWLKPRPGFIPVFYDGYRNNVTVADPICAELGLVAWFFPPTAFLATPAAEQRAFARAHNIAVVPEERTQDQVAMTWDDLAAMAERHVIAAHTAGHEACSNVRSAKDVEREVLEPARLIASATGKGPAAFAWLRGSPYDPAMLGNAALRDTGVRYLFSNTKVERLW